jgi:hypothetical protein
LNSTRPGVIQFSYEALFGVSSFLKCRPEVHVAFASIRALRVRTKEAPEKFLRRSTHNLRIGRGRRQGTRPDDLEHRRLGDRKRSARSNVFENATSKPSPKRALLLAMTTTRTTARSTTICSAARAQRHHIQRHFQIGFCLQRRPGVRILRTVATHQRPIGRVLHQRSEPAVPLVLNRITVAAAIMKKHCRVKLTCLATV